MERTGTAGPQSTRTGGTGNFWLPEELPHPWNRPSTPFLSPNQSTVKTKWKAPARGRLPYSLCRKFDKALRYKVVLKSWARLCLSTLSFATLAMGSFLDETYLLHVMSSSISRVSESHVQSCVKTFLLSSENHPQNVPLPTPKMHYDAIFQPAITKTWHGCFYTYLYMRKGVTRGQWPYRSAGRQGQ